MLFAELQIQIVFDLLQRSALCFQKVVSDMGNMDSRSNLICHLERHRHEIPCRARALTHMHV